MKETRSQASPKKAAAGGAGEPRGGAATAAEPPEPFEPGTGPGPAAASADQQLVNAAVGAVTLPVTVVKKVATAQNGLPAYLAVGGLAVVGVLEWPVAAVAGLGLAALRRWGPLRPDTPAAAAPAKTPAATRAASAPAPEANGAASHDVFVS